MAKTEKELKEMIDDWKFPIYRNIIYTGIGNSTPLHTGGVYSKILEDYLSKHYKFAFVLSTFRERADKSMGTTSYVQEKILKKGYKSPVILLDDDFQI